MPEFAFTGVNLTPHEITIIDRKGDDLIIRPDGRVARLSVSRETLSAVTVDGFELAVSRPVMGTPEGVPDQQEGTLLIVSALVAAHPSLSGRADIFSPGELLRDSEGRIIGARGLAHHGSGRATEAQDDAAWSAAQRVQADADERRARE